MDKMDKPSRRAMLSASLVPFSAVRGSAANSAVSVGIIGCGNRGTYLGQLLTEHTQARLSALCDVHPEAIAQAEKKIGRSGFAVFPDMEKLLASPVDAVMIATPVFLHPEHFEAAAQAGKHVYQEKPAAPDVEGCELMRRAAARAPAGRDLGFGFQRRHGVVYRKAEEMLKSGRLGSIRMAAVRFVKAAGHMPEPMPEPKTPEEKIRHWSAWRKLSGDLIVENNCHLIDVMNWFLGALPEAASGEGGRKMLRAGDNRDFGTVEFQYPGNVQGTLCGMTLAPSFHRDVREEYFGSVGYLETSELHWRYRLSKTEGLEEKAPRNPSVDSVVAFVERIRSGKTENTIARGVDSSLTSILGRLAMDLRRPVTWREMLASNGWPA